MKICGKCATPKNYTDFYRDKTQKDGYAFYCKECRNKAVAQWQHDNPQKATEIKYRWLKNNPTKASASSLKWNKNNAKRVNECSRLRRAKHPAECYRATRLWLKEHPEKVKEYNKRKAIKEASSVQGILNKSMRTYMCRSLRGMKGGRRWESLAGYSVNKLKTHLEKQFVTGMSWEEREKWHIDHKIPLSVFNFNKPEDIDFKKAWALENLQPMWAAKNISKGAKLTEPFQPSLAIGG
jgi:hypothetical protein